MLIEALRGTGTENTITALAAWLEQLRDNIGIATGDVTTTALGRLTALQNLANAQLECCYDMTDELNRQSGAPLVLCENPYISSGATVIPLELVWGVSLLAAQFPDPPPDGLTFGTNFGFNEDHCELVAADWSLYKVYIESTSPNFAVDLSVNRFDTNRWIILSGSGSRSFYVHPAHMLRVYICRTDDVPGLGESISCAGGEGYRYSELQGPDASGWYSISANVPPGWQWRKINVSGGGHGVYALFGSDWVLREAYKWHTDDPGPSAWSEKAQGWAIEVCPGV